MSLRRSPGAVNDYLELLLYRNQFQLVTATALYSDGNRYTPAVAAVKHLKSHMPHVQQVLVLGTGLGSIARVIDARGYKPAYTLVEKDKMVLGWALELLGATYAQRAEPICADAQDFMKQNRKKYDLVFIDIFNSMTVPEFVTTPQFLSQCRDSLTANGCVALNYIINDKEEWKRVKGVFASVFPGSDVVDMGVNRILLKTPNP